MMPPNTNLERCFYTSLLGIDWLIDSQLNYTDYYWHSKAYNNLNQTDFNNDYHFLVAAVPHAI